MCPCRTLHCSADWGGKTLSHQERCWSWARQLHLLPEQPAVLLREVGVTAADDFWRPRFAALTRSLEDVLLPRSGTERLPGLGTAHWQHLLLISRWASLVQLGTAWGYGQALQSPGSSMKGLWSTSKFFHPPSQSKGRCLKELLHQEEISRNCGYSGGSVFPN